MIFDYGCFDEDNRIKSMPLGYEYPPILSWNLVDLGRNNNAETFKNRCSQKQ